MTILILVEIKSLNYEIRVWPPQNIRYNKNVTLHFEIERLSFPLPSGYDNFFGPDNINIVSPKKKKLFNISVSPPARGDHLLAGRALRGGIGDKEISEANLQKMPGFRVKWNYTGIDFEPDPLAFHTTASTEFLLDCESAEY